MTTLYEFMDMGGYGAFIWPAYTISAAVLILLVVFSLRRLRQIESDLKPLEQSRKARRRQRSKQEGAIQ